VAPVETDASNILGCIPEERDTHTMSHIVDSCSLTKLDGSFSGLYTADSAVQWLANPESE